MLKLSLIDSVIIIGFLISVVAIGAAAARRASRSASDYFLSGRTMPWWLLGISMVACTFSCGTPNLITDIVRNDGVAGNWVWWAFLLTGMLTVFVYAKLWRRSELDTDLGFYEIRYGGKPAAVLRGFRAVYLGVFFNIMSLAIGSLAAIKIGQVIFGLTALQTLAAASVGVGIYATLGGLTGSIWADFYQYSVALGGAIAAAVYVVKANVGGTGVTSLATLWERIPAEKLTFFPSVEGGDLSLLVTVLVLPLAVQWWNVWYPGAEPGGGGYIAQRMLAAKNERHAIGATMLFNFMHYGVRTWPWLIVALVSIVVLPKETPAQQAQSGMWLKENAALVQNYNEAGDNLTPEIHQEIRYHTAAVRGHGSLAKAFPEVEDSFLRDDIAYPGMIARLPAGLLGLVVASLIAAHMSTVATHLNWGASYVVNDVYLRFLKPKATAKQQVRMARIATVLLLLAGSGAALLLQGAKGAFDVLLQVGAGTGLIYILRWFWWRINAYSEIAAMVISFAVAILFKFVAEPLGVESMLADAGLLKIMAFSGWKLVIGISCTTVGWLLVTWLTPPEEMSVLVSFCRKIRAGGPGWRKVEEYAAGQGTPLGIDAKNSGLPLGILCMMLGCAAVWGLLFTLGYILYGRWIYAAVLGTVSVIATVILMRLVPRIKFG
ncbi:MAG: Na+:solute symporter [Kiritimatiellae bacterium]|jgi:SSS family solute:Na+ symporter|nr:Na+:solute symporter [Kiritimatiellia bacterium]